MFQNSAFGGSAFGNSGGAMSFGSSDASIFSSGGSGSMNPIDTAFSNSSEPRGSAVGGFGSNGY